MIALWLLACRPEPVDTDPVDVIPDVDTDVEVPFTSPAEAVDLDEDPGVLQVHLVADEAVFTVAGEEVDGYAYNGQVPGPTLRAKVGDTLTVTLENALDQPTTLHWHGLVVPWAMDGVTWMQDPVGPGETFTYTFPLTDAGTFWYHPHFDGGGQVDLGLYGAIVVEDPAEPVADVEIVAVFDAWSEAVDTDTERHGNPNAPHGSGDLLAWTVNGFDAPAMALPGGTTARVRLINVSNTGYLDLRFAEQEWLKPRLIAADQGLLAKAGAAEGLVLAPGDRAELEILVGADGAAMSTAAYSLAGGPALGRAQDLLTLTADPPGERPAPLPFAFSGALPSDDPGYADVIWVFQGDGSTWFINGEQYPDVTIPEVGLGAGVVIEIRNMSSTNHPFHLHGYAFEVLSVDGVPPDHQRMEDTIDVPIRSVVRLRITADNPGDWMAHCHILPHAHDMMTVLRVQ